MVEMVLGAQQAIVCGMYVVNSDDSLSSQNIKSTYANGRPTECLPHDEMQQLDVAGLFVNHNFTNDQDLVALPSEEQTLNYEDDRSQLLASHSINDSCTDDPENVNLP